MPVPVSAVRPAMAFFLALTLFFLPTASARTAPFVPPDPALMREYSLIAFAFVLLALFYILSTPSEPSKQKPSSKKHTLYSLDYSYFVTVGWSMPSIAIYGSVIVAMILHFEGVSTTHCRTAWENPFPSVSAAVGNYTPERWIFRFGILFMSCQRLLDAWILQSSFKKTLPHTHWMRSWSRTHSIAHILENFCLFALTYIASREYYPYHEKSFILWALFSWFKIFIHLWLYSKVVAMNNTPETRRVMYHKKLVAACNVLSFVFMVSCFVVHNLYCPPFFYALYAVTEYFLIGTNIAFNCLMMMTLPYQLTFAIFPHTQTVSKVED